MACLCCLRWTPTTSERTPRTHFIPALYISLFAPRMVRQRMHSRPFSPLSLWGPQKQSVRASKWRMVICRNDAALFLCEGFFVLTRNHGEFIASFLEVEGLRRISREPLRL